MLATEIYLPTNQLSLAINHPSESGDSFPLGATLFPDGTNFSLFCKNGTSVELLLFDSIDDIEPSTVIPLDARRNKTYHYWHTFVPKISSGQLYAYRIHGPFEPWNGHRYDATNILLDPYAKIVAVPERYRRSGANSAATHATPSMKSVVTDLSLYNWEGDAHLKIPFSRTIIYEMHVAGFTRNPNSMIEPNKRGTYAGLIEKIPYLVDLGITAVELLPVFQFDEQDAPNGLVNYWGYSPVSFFAPHHAYGSSKTPLHILDEFRDMVKAFHRAGIEIILDVVFNHTAEGNQEGPTFCYRGIDNSIYYILEEEKSYYSNFSGTGNTLNANQPIVRRMIIDSLRFWATEMHVDGFRFDLASILSRDEKGRPSENPPVLWDIESDPFLAGIKLIAEAWDAAGLYQVGSFVGDSWKEWNGRFRDDLRSFVRGDEGTVPKLVTRLIGSPDIYGHKDREPEQSINFITCHDGFTLNDLVSYNSKHNEANKEENRDGNNDNLSWNCGTEGPTDNPEIESLRNRQVKNFLTALLSIGTPMISMGDEVRRTQNGNNNGYCQNNELSWFDWSLVEKHADIYRFVKYLINGRLQRDVAKPEYGMSLNQLLEKRLVTWHGVKVNQPDWSHESHSIAFTVQSLSADTITHYMLNAYYEPLEFELPRLNDGIEWKRWIDTALESPDDICGLNVTSISAGGMYLVHPRSTVVLSAVLTSNHK
jgi:glycogen operon protein